MNVEKQTGTITMIKTKDLIKIYNVHRNTILRWRKLGMPHTNIGRVVRYNLNEVAEWLKNYNKE